MFSDSSKAECLNLSVNYVSHWTYLQALREIFQNFMDACIEKHSEYKILIRKNEGANKVIFTQAKRENGQLEEIQCNKIVYDAVDETLTF